MYRKFQILQLSSPDTRNSEESLGHSFVTCVQAIMCLRRDAVNPHLCAINQPIALSQFFTSSRFWKLLLLLLRILAPKALDSLLGFHFILKSLCTVFKYCVSIFVFFNIIIKELGNFLASYTIWDGALLKWWFAEAVLWLQQFYQLVLYGLSKSYGQGNEALNNKPCHPNSFFYIRLPTGHGKISILLKKMENLSEDTTSPWIHKTCLNHLLFLQVKKDCRAFSGCCFFVCFLIFCTEIFQQQ